jgi:hypothetical protein
MLVNIFNSFNPTQFLIDSPLWVSFVAYGIIFVICLVFFIAVTALIIRDKGAVIGTALAIGTTLAVADGLWMMATLMGVFKHAGVNEGYPLVLAVAVGVISNILVVAIIARTVFVTHRFIQARLSPKS